MRDPSDRSDLWALGYLRGRAHAFRRGKLSLANVAGAVRLARARQVRDADVRLILSPFGLDWDGFQLRDPTSADVASADASKPSSATGVGSATAVDAVTSL